jgi:hypothetical protein
METRQVTFAIDKELYDCFRAACLKRTITPSRVMVQLIGEEMLRWHELRTYVSQEPRPYSIGEEV